MGCSPGDAECKGSEKPAHEVTLAKGFWMGQTPVTAGAWKKMGMTLPPEPTSLDHALNPGWRDEQQPIVNVTWDQAKEYCEAVGMRLPTEAEWEYAARGGTFGARYGGVDEIAWYADNSGDKKIQSAPIFAKDPANYRQRLKENGNRPHDVGTKRANAWKLYDMLGNVWQWVGDWYDEHSYEQRDGTDPIGPPSGKFRAQHGGSWLATPETVRVSNRGWGAPGDHDSDTGFRCVGE
jgi:formylglycine-generating enzyme required for sulfatase activity